MTRKRAKPPAAKAAMIIVESQQDLINAYKQVFSTVEGQIVLADLLMAFGHNVHSSFVPASFSSAGTRTEDLIFTEGQRSVILHIGRRCDALPDSEDNQGKVEL